MTGYEPRDPHFEARVADSFQRQGLLVRLGARLVSVQPGRVAIELPFHEDLTQQHGYVHAAAISAIADSACGYAALSLMAPGRDVLSVEFKVNLLAPAEGERFVAVGRVIRPGRTLTVCSADVNAHGPTQETLIAQMQATMISIAPRSLRSDHT